MQKTKLYSLLFATLLFSVAGASAQTVLFDIATATTSGVGQNVFAASATSGGSGASLSVSASDLILTNGSATSGQTDYFVAKFASTSLVAVGDKLTLSYAVTATHDLAGAQTFRVGLSDIGTATNGGTVGYGASTGYRVDYGTNGLVNAVNGLRERTVSNVNLLATGAAPIIAGTVTGDTTFSLSSFNGVLHTGSLTVELLAGGMVSITSQIDGLTSSITDTTTPFTSFNSLAFMDYSDGTKASLDFTTLSVTYTTVPEPDSLALVISAGVGALFLIRRRGLTSL